MSEIIYCMLFFMLPYEASRDDIDKDDTFYVTSVVSFLTNWQITEHSYHLLDLA